jgi:DNA polymerase IV (DinB-like DNA polymerase)
MGREVTRLPGAELDSGDQIVLHVDMDCFYAACERVREPELRGEPVIIGMGYDTESQTGAVATASYEAREYGVESAQPISKALEVLPNREQDAPVEGPTAYYRPVDMGYYKDVSSAAQNLLAASVDTLRIVSIDEAYLDITPEATWGDVEVYVENLKAEITDRTGLTASVGVAPNMSTAKIASEYNKPDGSTIVPPGEVREFLAPLSIEQIHGIGPVTAGKLREMGYETAGDLAGASSHRVVDRFGERGREMQERARGIDRREVTPMGKPKSLSRESSVSPLTAYDEKRAVIQRLARAVAERASSKDARYRTIGIKIVETPFELHTRRSRTLDLSSRQRWSCSGSSNRPRFGNSG